MQTTRTISRVEHPRFSISRIGEYRYGVEINAFPGIHQRNRSKGQHMQKAELSVPRIAPVKKAVKAETVTLRHLAMALAESNDLKKTQVNAMLMDMVGEITKHLKKGRRIRLNGLGILQVRKRPARMGRNPATGAAIKIKASKKVAFRVAKDLKQAV